MCASSHSKQTDQTANGAGNRGGAGANNVTAANTDATVCAPIATANISVTDSFFNPNITPEWVQALIQKNYEGACNKPKRPYYLFFGETVNVQFRAHQLEISLPNIMYALHIKNKFKKYIDLGAGANEPVHYAERKYGVSGLGITAASYIKGINASTKNYKLANGEYFSEIKEAHDADLVSSTNYFKHIEDTAKSLADLYRAAPLGGMIIIDNFLMRGLDGWLRDLIEYLKLQGHQITAQYTCTPGMPAQEEFGFICVVKTERELLLPIKYEKQVEHYSRIDKVGYAPTEVLKEYRARTYAETKKVSIEEVKSSLLACFEDPSFLSSEPLEQGNKIKQIVKNIGLEQHREIIDSLSDMGIRYFYNQTVRDCPQTKLRVFELKHSFEQEAGLLLLIAVATLELQVEKDIEDCNQFFLRYLDLNLVHSRERRLNDVILDGPLKPILAPWESSPKRLETREAKKQSTNTMLSALGLGAGPQKASMEPNEPSVATAVSDEVLIATCLPRDNGSDICVSNNATQDSAANAGAGARP